MTQAATETLQTLTPAQAARLASVPRSGRKTYLRVLTGKAPPRLAIKVMCLECQGWDRAGVAACTSTACPLHGYRPFQGSEI